jgi:hypothetical protein
MITEELINNADEKVKSLCSENKKIVVLDLYFNLCFNCIWYYVIIFCL